MEPLGPTVPIEANHIAKSFLAHKRADIEETRKNISYWIRTICANTREKTLDYLVLDDEAMPNKQLVNNAKRVA